ncbi:MAG: hypothetical protein ACK5MY_12910 [Jhaorihella sp.]
MEDENEVLAVLAASRPRRALAAGAVGLAGVGVIYGAVTGSMAPVWQVLLALGGCAALWGAGRMWRATAGRIELTAAGLRGGDGIRIVPIGEIELLERGPFSAKPSNGFLIRLHRPGRAAWHPGMWWRLGRRVGVGGVSSRAEARVMAERLAGLLAARGPGEAPGAD